MPSAGAVTTSTSVARGSGASGSPPWARTMARQASMAPPVGEHVGGVAVVEADEGEHLPGQGDGELDDVGGPAAGQHLDRLGHLERVAGRAPERHVHLREQRGGAHAVGGAQPDHRLGQRRGRWPRPS